MSMRSRQKISPTYDAASPTASWPLSHRSGNNESRRLSKFMFYFLAGTLAVLVVFKLDHCHGSLARVSDGGSSGVARDGNDDDDDIGPTAMVPQEGDRKGGDTGSLGSAGQSPSKRPAGWEGYGMHDIREHFNCGKRSADPSKPVTTAGEWELLRRTLADAVEGDEVARFLDDPVPPHLGYTLESERGPPPFYAKRSPGRGRGLFARRDIRKGEVIHDDTLSTFYFPDAMSYRRFVFSLPRDLACDVTDWNWTQEDDKGGFQHCLDLNIAAYMNSDRRKFNTLADTKTSPVMRATRDIAKDEEILMNYAIYLTDWKAVGL